MVSAVLEAGTLTTILTSSVANYSFSLGLDLKTINVMVKVFT